MANAIRYSTTGDTQSLKKGNFFFGVGDVGKGPSSATTYYNGSTPVASGYTIYSYDVTQTSRISYASPTTDSEFISITNAKSGQNFTGVTQCLNWYATQTDHVAVNKDYEPIVSNGLVLNLDASYTPSYTSSGTTWYDLAYSGNNGTLTNGPTFSSANGGSIVFDGVDDNVELLPNYTTITTSGTVEIAIKFNGTNSYKHIWTFDKSDAPEIRLATAPGGNFGFFIYDTPGGYRFQSTPITPAMYSNVWIYVQVVWGNNDYRIYLNGSIIVSQSSGGVITNTGPATTSRLGNYPRAGSSQFNGSIGNFRIYNRALTATEVLQNFNAQKSRFGL